MGIDGDTVDEHSGARHPRVAASSSHVLGAVQGSSDDDGDWVLVDSVPSVEPERVEDGTSDDEGSATSVESDNHQSDADAARYDTVAYGAAGSPTDMRPAGLPSTGAARPLHLDLESYVRATPPLPEDRGGLGPWQPDPNAAWAAAARAMADPVENPWLTEYQRNYLLWEKQKPRPVRVQGANKPGGPHVESASRSFRAKPDAQARSKHAWK